MNARQEKGLEFFTDDDIMTIVEFAELFYAIEKRVNERKRDKSKN